MTASHICTVCNRDMLQHDEQCNEGCRHWPPLCCEGCDCDSQANGHIYGLPVITTDYDQKNLEFTDATDRA